MILAKKHTPDILWEGLKAKLISEAMEFSIKKAKSRKNLINILQLKLVKLDQKLVEGGPHIDKIKKDIKRTEEFMLNEHEIDTAGAIFRSKTQYYDQGGKPSKYFFNLERSRSRAKAIVKIQNDDGEIIENPKEILKELQRYYSKLYSSQTHTKLKGIEIPPLPKLNEDFKTTLDSPFTIQELTEALYKMPNDKCPGLDGLTTEFYKAFWNKLKVHYFIALIFNIKEGRLHQSARLGLLSLLPKKDKNGLFVKNWRPLTLMNVDYKIYLKALSLRLKEVLSTLVHEDQYGFMAGRDISMNIRRTLDIIEFSDNNQLQALIMQIDSLKAFDSLEHDTIFDTLRLYGFGDEFVAYVAVLFQSAFTCVVNNGWKS